VTTVKNASRPPEVDKPPEHIVEYIARCEAERRRRQVNVPTWVPAKIREYVRWIECLSLQPMQADDEKVRRLSAVQRLAIAPAMRHVWKELERRKASDEALWLFFSSASDAASNAPQVFTKKDRAELVRIQHNAALLCAMQYEQVTAKVERRQPFLSQPGARAQQREERQLAAALELVAKYFSASAVKLSRAQSPLFVKHRTKDDEARAYVRVVGDETKKLFGSTLFRTVATVATIALQRPVDWRQVRKWCDKSNTSSAPSDSKKKHSAVLTRRK
jgi:hypothetical protein